MKAFKTRIKLKKLKSIIDIPTDFNSPDVEIIVLSDSEVRKSSFVKREKKELGGVFNKYADTNLIKNEKDYAWGKVIEDKHGIL